MKKLVTFIVCMTLLVCSSGVSAFGRKQTKNWKALERREKSRLDVDRYL